MDVCSTVVCAVEENKTENGGRKCWAGLKGLLNSVVRKGLPEKMDRGSKLCGCLGPGRSERQCKGPVGGAFPASCRS